MAKYYGIDDLTDDLLDGAAVLWLFLAMVGVLFGIMPQEVPELFSVLGVILVGRFIFRLLVL